MVAAYPADTKFTIMAVRMRVKTERIASSETERNEQYKLEVPSHLKIAFILTTLTRFEPMTCTTMISNIRSIKPLSHQSVENTEKIDIHIPDLKMTFLT